LRLLSKRKADLGLSGLLDVEGRPLLLFKNDFWLQETLERHAHLRFIAAVQPGRSERAAA
jgi:hypothetical protein